MYLSYSGYKTFASCPQEYWHQYINHTQLPALENRVPSLYGSIVGRLFEVFYNDRIWAIKGSEEALLKRVEPMINEVILQETTPDKRGRIKGQLIWDDPKLSIRTRYKSRDQLAKDIRETIPRGLATIRHHRFIGLDAKAEVKLDSTIEGHTIAGRADFLLTRVKPHNDLVLLDGKGSKWRGSYVDARQLRWYGMLHREHFGVTPTKLGFVYWRFEPEQAVDWIPFSEQDLNGIRGAALDAIRSIEEGQQKMVGVDSNLPKADLDQALLEAFPPSPSDQCQLCAYHFACLAGQNMTSGRFTLPNDEDLGVDVDDVGFGPGLG